MELGCRGAERGSSDSRRPIFSDVEEKIDRKNGLGHSLVAAWPCTTSLVYLLGCRIANFLRKIDSLTAFRKVLLTKKQALFFWRFLLLFTGFSVFSHGFSWVLLGFT